MLSSAPRHARQLRTWPAIRIPTVCVVDPRPDDYQGWSSLAQGGEVRLQIVTSAEAALRQASAGEIDLWVVNTNLPRLSGYELCSMLKARSENTAVYLLADEYSLEAERSAWRSRATFFGCKPAHTSLLDRWLAHGRRQMSRRSA